MLPVDVFTRFATQPSLTLSRSRLGQSCGGHVARLPGYSLVTILLPASSAHGFKGLREGDNQAWGVYCPPCPVSAPRAAARSGHKAITIFGTCETWCSVLGLRRARREEAAAVLRRLLPRRTPRKEEAAGVAYGKADQPVSQAARSARARRRSGRRARIAADGDAIKKTVGVQLQRSICQKGA